VHNIENILIIGFTVTRETEHTTGMKGLQQGETKEGERGLTQLLSYSWSIASRLD